MTKAEKFEKAWRLEFKEDFSLVDEIYHPDYNFSTTERVLKQTSKMTRWLPQHLVNELFLDPIERCLRMKTFYVLRGSQSDLQMQTNQITEWE